MSDSETVRFPDLPPYTHVPGVTPHPISHADGHMQGHSDSIHDGWTNADWMQWGQTLFDRGYYWEAHEAWEHLWIELGRKGSQANSVKGLIKLAACGVKILESNQTGALRHAVRAAELLAASKTTIEFGQSLEIAHQIAQHYVASPHAFPGPSSGDPKPVVGFQLSES